jgi:hypothetical protein
MFQCFNKIRINYYLLTFIFIPLLVVMTCMVISNKDYSMVSVAGKVENESGSGNTKIDYSIVPTNISVLPESLPEGNLYFFSILSNGTITYTRNLTDEVFPFQLNRWYQQIQFVPNYQNLSPHENLTITNLVIGQMSDFDNFDRLLDQARIYKHVPLNSNLILDLPNNDVSFMLAQVRFPDGYSGIYYGLYDGNQKTDKSELESYMNPESNPSNISFVPATEIKSNNLFYNITFTLVCNDLYKLGYNRCIL